MAGGATWVACVETVAGLMIDSNIEPVDPGGAYEACICRSEIGEAREYWAVE